MHGVKLKAKYGVEARDLNRQPIYVNDATVCFRKSENNCVG